LPDERPRSYHLSEAARRLDTYPNAINRWIAKGELEAFRVEGRGFRFVDAEQVEGLRLALEGFAEQGRLLGKTDQQNRESKA